VIALVLFPYMVIVLLWWWEPSRFVIPILPLLAHCACVGAKIIFGRTSLSTRKIAWCSAAICLIGCIAVDLDDLHHVMTVGDFYGPDAAAHWKQVQKGLGWVRQNTPADAVVFSDYPAGVYLLTDRHTLDMNNSSHIGNTYIPSNSIDLAAEIAKAAPYRSLYIFAVRREDVLSHVEFGLAPVRGFVTDHPDALQLQWSSDNNFVQIYKVTRDRQGDDLYSMPR
jgi:hypothetical protein